MKTILFLTVVFCGVIAIASSLNTTSGVMVATTGGSTTGQSTVPFTGTTADTSSTTQQTSSVESTTAPVVTTAGAATTPSPTAPGSETKNDYVVYEKNNTVCLKARFAAHFKKEKQVWNISNDAEIDNATSQCGVLSVIFKDGSFQINFGQTSKGAFYINATQAKLNDDKKVIIAKAENLTLAKAANGSSYLCSSGITIDLSGNVTFYLTDFQVQAYYVKDGKFATAVKCDSDLSPLVPIIVGAVLAGLILIVVVAYFIGRNRNRVGYEEI